MCGPRRRSDARQDTRGGASHVGTRGGGKSFFAEQLAAKPGIGGRKNTLTNTHTQTRSVAHNYTYTFLFFCDGVRPIAQLPQITRIIYWILLFFLLLLASSRLVWYALFHFFLRRCSLFLSSFLIFFLLSYLRLTFSFFAFLLSTGHVLFSAWFLSSFPVTCAALCAFLARPTEIINRTKPMWFRSFICITFLLLFYLPLMCSVFSLLFSANNSANKRKDILIHNSSFSLQPLLI